MEQKCCLRRYEVGAVQTLEEILPITVQLYGHIRSK
jgi:hypothetical protein